MKQISRGMQDSVVHCSTRLGRIFTRMTYHDVTLRVSIDELILDKQPYSGQSPPTSENDADITGRIRTIEPNPSIE